MNYIAEDTKSKKIKKLALMLQNLDVNIYIYGDEGVGKTFLANFISNGIIIENFDNLKSFPKTDKRIIAIGSKPLSTNLKEKFDITIEIYLESLQNRPKDLKEFINYFILEAKKELKLKDDFKVNVDISKNLNSLKREIYKSALCKIDTKREMIKILETYFDEHYNDSSYNEELKLFDEAIIKSLQKKYKSKLQIAKYLKINRATLSKKVEEIENKLN